MCASYTCLRVNPNEYTNSLMLSEQSSKAARFRSSYDLLLNSMQTEMLDSLTIKINCPITLQRIKYPVRGMRCTHLQCFDLDTYVSMNSTLKRWACPVCGKHTVTMRWCPLTSLILKRTEQHFPLDDRYKNANSNELTDLLLSEANNSKFADDCTSLEYVTIVKEGLQI